MNLDHFTGKCGHVVRNVPVHLRDPIGDAKKSNLAGLHGWTVLFYKPDEVRDGRAVNEIARTLEEINENQD